MELGTDNPIDKAIITIENYNYPTQELLDGLKILRTVINHLIDSPQEEKFKKLNKSNEKLQKNLFSIHGVPEFLSVLGFADLDDCYYFVESDIGSQELEKAVKILTNRINNFKIPRLLSENPHYREIKKRLDELEEKKKYKEELIKALERNKKDVWTERNWNPEKYFPKSEDSNQGVQ